MANPYETLTERQLKVLRMFPRFMHESEFIHDFVEAITDEATSRAGDLMTELLLSQRPSLVREDFIELLEEQFSIPTDTSENLDTRRGRIFAKSFRGPRSRIIDIANTVRLYLIGNKTYTSAAINNSRNVRVRDVTGFTVGMTIYVGSEERTIDSINREEQILRVDTAITVGAYTLVTDSQVEVADDPSTYSFQVYLVPGSFDPDITKMARAIEEIKPAHLGFSIWTAPIIEWDVADYSWEGSESDLPYDEDVPYDEDAPYDGDLGEIAYWDGGLPLYST